MSNKRRKSEYLLSEIGGIDEGFLAEAESYRRRNPVWLKPTVAVACACLLVVGALGAMMNGNFMAKGEVSMDRVPENNMSVNGSGGGNSSGGNNFEEYTTESPLGTPEENGNSEVCTEVGSEENTDLDSIIESNFVFEYAIYSVSGERGDLFARGDRIKVVTKITNVGKDHIYEGAETDYRADIVIYCDVNGERVYLEREPVASTEDYVTHVIKSGDSREATYYFTVPSDAPTLWFTVELSYNGEGIQFEQGVLVYNPGFADGKTEHSRSPVLISSGGDSIRPLSFFAGEEEYDENGEPYYTLPADYFGYYEIYYMLNDGEITADEIPTLVLSRDFAVTHVPRENQVENFIRIRTVASDEVIYHGEILGLFDLPEGEYLAEMSHFFKNTEKTYTGEEGHYIGYDYDMVFRLIVPEKSVLEMPPPQYSYSRTEIGSGTNRVSPISCCLYENWYGADGTPFEFADGYGVYWIFEVAGNPNPKYFPTLIRDGEVKIISIPVNAYTSGSVSLYDLNFQRIEYSGGWEGLANLPAGDYLVVYLEEYDSRGCNPEPQEYVMTGNECLFRLIVTE